MTERAATARPGGPGTTVAPGRRTGRPLSPKLAATRDLARPTA
ncbi:hypothetical protein [Streptomyces sp. NPDC002952]